MNRWTLAAGLLGLGVAACGGETLEEAVCPPDGTTLTYENFGEAFLGEHCNRCHSAADGEREGAPEEFVFGTRGEVKGHAARIFARAAGENVSMPPGPDDPPGEERERLREWLACGVP